MVSVTRLIIPLKSLSESKTAFSEILSEEQRKELSLKMLEDTLAAAKQVDEVELSVVTPDEAVTDFAEGMGAEVIQEPDAGLNRALEIAIGKSVEDGYERVLILPGDVPLVRPEDIEEILEAASGARSVVIVPSKENGTNALLLSPPDVMDIHFGGESFPEHVKEARSRELKPRIYRSENLERDIDEPSHLLKVETLGKGTKTHSFLDSLK